MDNIKLAELDKLLGMLKENFSTMKDANESMIRVMEKLMESGMLCINRSHQGI
jgi:hypothetical protein